MERCLGFIIIVLGSLWRILKQDSDITSFIFLRRLPWLVYEWMLAQAIPQSLQERMETWVVAVTAEAAAEVALVLV